MYLSKLRSAAENILNENINPLERERLGSRLSTLGRLLGEIRSLDEPGSKESLETLLMRVEDDQFRAHKLLFQVPLDQEKLRISLREAVYCLGALLEEYRQPPGPTRLILPTVSAKAVGVSAKGFRHIPYSYVSVGLDELSEVARACAAHHVRANPEKTYYVLPLRSPTESQWNLELIHAPKAWDVTKGKGVKVGVADTGADYSHPEIVGRFTSNLGWDFIKDDNNPYDDNGHGTHVSGTVAGVSFGVAPGATLYALKFLDANGRGREVDFIRAAEWAIDNGLDVLNGSFGSSMPSSAEGAICDKLYEEGILFCASAGNRGTPDYSYPASYGSVISVAAVDKNKERASFSQYNDMLSLSAPGVAVNSCIPGGRAEYSGTSMAAPHVSGTGALLTSEAGDPELVRDALLQGCEELGRELEYGHGLVRPDKSLELCNLVKKYSRRKAA